jgi:iron-sulfur cluster assembly protein
MSQAQQQSSIGTPGIPATPPSTGGTQITMTDKAVKEIKRIRESDPDSKDSYLRVMVTGGGCSGMSYKLGFEKEAPKSSDKIFERDGVQVIIDPKSLLFLTGTELDFSDGLNGTGFTFKNPNAKRTCGCGSSFSV